MSNPDREKDLSAWTTATKPTTPTAPVVPKPVEPTSGIPLNVSEAYTILESRKAMFPLDRRELTQAEQMRLFPGVDLAPKNLEQLAEFFDKGYVTPPPSDVREPFLIQFGKGLWGGAEDLTQRLAYTALPDAWIDPSRGKQRIALPDKKPFIALQGVTSREEVAKMMNSGRAIEWLRTQDEVNARKKQVEEDWARGYQLIDQDLKPWEFERNQPESTLGAFGRMIGGGLGVSEEPMTPEQLLDEPFFMQALNATLPGMHGVIASPGGTRLLGAAIAGDMGLKPISRVLAPNSPVVSKLTKALADAKLKIPEQKELYRIEKGRRTQGLTEIIDEASVTGIPTVEDARRGFSAFKGELPKVEYKAISDQFNADEMAELERLMFTRSKTGNEGAKGVLTRRDIYGDKYSIDALDYATNMDAFRRLLFEDKLPTAGDVKRLEKIFGSDFVDEVTGMKSLGKKAWAQFMDTWNLPKALIASIDISAPGRQGWKLAFSPYSKEYWGAFKAQFKLLDPFLGDQKFDVLMDTIRSHRHYDIVKNQMKVFEGELGVGRRGTNSAEDAYMSRFVSRIPAFKISERAYTGFLNKLRYDAAFKQLDNWEKAGYRYTKTDLEDLGRLINYSTGRGSIPSGRLSDILNSLFFSPRFAVSTPQFYGFPLETGTRMLLRKPAARNAEVSKIWAKIAVGHVVKTAGILWGLKEGFEATNQRIDIELDPRATDFGKIVIDGKLRYDFWGGDAQWAKFVARIVTGDRKSGTTGEIEDIAESEEIFKMFRSKLNPMAANAWEIGVTQEDFYGNAITTDPESVKEQAMNRLLFMGAQDVVDAASIYKDSDAIAFAAPGFLGVGVQSYETTLSIKNEIALQNFDALYEDLDYATRNDIDAQPRVLAFEDERARKKKPESIDKQWFDGVGGYKKRIQEIEVGSEREPGLLRVIESGAQGKPLDNAIRKYLTQKSLAWKDNIPFDVAEVKSARTTDLLYMYRQKYWSVPLPIDLRTGIPDYDQQQADRDNIELEARVAAQNAGMTGHQFITDMKEPGRVSDNQVINDAVTEWLDDQEYLRTNFYDIADQFIKDMGYWDYYQKMKSSQYSQLYREIDPSFSGVLREVNTLKQQLRLIDPRIESILFKRGSISNVTNPQVQVEAGEQFDPNEIIDALKTIGQ
tara:strand:- start:5525 stop:8992 length:3468 start_codon:yes stop_codon:yes gene_type:complete